MNVISQRAFSEKKNKNNGREDFMLLEKQNLEISITLSTSYCN